MRYYTYIDTTGKTLFFESEQVNRKGFVGIFTLSANETKYFRYNGIAVEKDNLLYEIFIRENLNEYKDYLKKLVLVNYNHSVAKLKSAYPVEETTGWDIKSLQSKVWIESEDKQALLDSDSVLMLKNESDGTIEGMTNLAQRVLNNSNLYQIVYGKNTKRYKEYLSEINTASELSELSVIEGSIKYD